jgi:hypothetical protein
MPPAETAKAKFDPEGPSHRQMTLILLLNQAGGRRLSWTDDASPTLANCLRLTAVAGRDENVVNEVLTEHGPEKWEPVFR